MIKLAAKSQDLVPTDGPQRRDAVEIPLAVGVEQVEAISGDKDRDVVIAKRLHRREGMPDVRVVPVAESLGIHSRDCPD